MNTIQLLVTSSLWYSIVRYQEHDVIVHPHPQTFSLLFQNTIHYRYGTLGISLSKYNCHSIRHTCNTDFYWFWIDWRTSKHYNNEPYLRQIAKHYINNGYIYSFISWCIYTIHFLFYWLENQIHYPRWLNVETSCLLVKNHWIDAICILQQIWLDILDGSF